MVFERFMQNTPFASFTFYVANCGGGVARLRDGRGGGWGGSVARLRDRLRDGRGDGRGGGVARLRDGRGGGMVMMAE